MEGRKRVQPYLHLVSQNDHTLPDTRVFSGHQLDSGVSKMLLYSGWNVSSDVHEPSGDSQDPTPSLRGNGADS